MILRFLRSGWSRGLRRLALAGLIAPMALLGAAGTALAAPPLRVPAFVGMAVPGMPDRTFTSLGGATILAPPAVNAAGEVAFWAQISDPGVSFGSTETIWSTTGGSLSLVAIEGEPAPGGGVFVTLAQAILIDDAGSVAFGALVDADGDLGTNTDLRLGVYVLEGEELRQVMREGQTIPQPDPVSPVFGFQFSSLGAFANFLAPFSGDPYLFAGGRAAVSAQASPAPGDPASIGTVTGIWSEQPATLSRALTLLARSGPDTNFSGLSLGGDPDGINGLGWAIFDAMVTIPDPDRPPGSDLEIIVPSIWSENGGSLTQVVQALGRDPGDFTGFGARPDINDAGNAAFEAGFLDPDGLQSSGIFKQVGGGTAGLVVAAETVAPGTSDLSGDGTPDFLFSSFGNPLLSDADSVVFLATATTPDQSQSVRAIWTDRAGGLLQLVPVAFVGDPAPGLPAGTVYTAFPDFGENANFAVNAAGDVAFFAEFEAPDGTQGTGIWAEREGELRLVVQAVLSAPPGALVQPDVLPLPDGGSLVAELLNFVGGSGNSDGRMSGFSDTGEVAFRAIQSSGPGGSAIFVPEPGAPAAAGAALAVLAALARSPARRRVRGGTRAASKP